MSPHLIVSVLIYFCCMDGSRLFTVTLEFQTSEPCRAVAEYLNQDIGVLRVWAFTYRHAAYVIAEDYC